MGTISCALNTFFSQTVCLIAMLRGTTGEMGVYPSVFLTVPWSYPGESQEGSRRTKKVVVDEPQPGDCVIVMIVWESSLYRLCGVVNLLAIFLTNICLLCQTF